MQPADGRAGSQAGLRSGGGNGKEREGMVGQKNRRKKKTRNPAEEIQDLISSREARGARAPPPCIVSSGENSAQRLV